MQNVVAGLDIGTTKICAVAGTLNEYGKLDIIGFSRASSEGGVKEGVVLNIQKTSEVITRVIKELEDNFGVVVNTVNVGIAGKHINCIVRHHGITRKNNDSVITSADINRLTHEMYSTVVEPGNQIIHVMPRNYTVDYEVSIKDPIGMSGTKLEADFNIITAKTTSITNIKRSVELSNLVIQNLILEPLASSLAVLSEEEKEAGVVLVDMGGGTTDIAIFQDGIIRHAAVLPFGGNIITNDIKTGCGVLQHHAELLKVKHGRALQTEAPNEIISIQSAKDRPSKEISSKNLAAIIEARVVEIIHFIQSEIRKSDSLNPRACSIVLTGGGAKLRHIAQLFEYVTGMDTRVGHPNEHLGKTVVEEVKEPMYATAIGLVLAGFMSIDERENQWDTTKGRTKGGSASPIFANEKRKKGISFINAITQQLKIFLTDDFKGKDEFK